MKLFDRNGDGEFDARDYLMVTTFVGVLFNMLLNVFSVLDIGLSLTNHNGPILKCEIVDFQGKNQLKCFAPEDRNAEANEDEE